MGAVAPRGRPKADLSPKPVFWLFFQGFKAREPFQRLPSHISLLVGGLSAHPVRTLSIPENFSVFYLTCFIRFRKNKNKAEVQKINIFDEHQSCSPFNSVQDAPSIKLWGPYFDDFVDISIFMIWGSWGIQPLC